MLRLIAVLLLMLVTACSDSTSPPATHIVTAKSAPFRQTPTGPLVQQQIILDQLAQWCHVESATVFAALKVGDTVPPGTCTWYPTTP